VPTSSSPAGRGVLPRVLSGIQPTSTSFHLGNYLGALKQWVALQHTHEAFYCVVDLHAITLDPPAPELLRERTRSAVAQLIAAGLDPEGCTLFVQSQVAAHTQLSWVLECIAGFGEASRMTQFKDKSTRGTGEHYSVGLFTYPVLQAADILLYQSDAVPVGEDQRQHIELCRDLAQRINAQRGDVLKVPAPLISEVGARVMGLDTPDEKMSKSTAMKRPGHAVLLLDAPDVVRKKVARATTDTEPSVHKPVGPGVANLLDMYAALRDVSADAALAEFGGKTYSVLKGAVADAIVEALTPIQARYAELRADEDGLRTVLADSAERVHRIADATLLRVQEAVGVR
jgi:tryptophanyl-tRNA synthetase